MQVKVKARPKHVQISAPINKERKYKNKKKNN